MVVARWRGRNRGCPGVPAEPGFTSFYRHFPESRSTPSGCGQPVERLLRDASGEFYHASVTAGGQGWGGSSLLAVWLVVYNGAVSRSLCLSSG
ncbi:hypothetical protein [Candidatus Laterigemmans baculatus]|uniref:hypothetical protein n=1 Tax=Candidatus Laterigemmans baculatus TaxID=2770505 RepID=UPI0013DCDC35|nr:hypothetical protein [Candidatus Laterigemmans baculatus]